MLHATLTARNRSELPVPLTALVGREVDIAAVLATLNKRETRLLTLIGPGGVGKTRLAIAVATAASDGFPDGVIWVPLTPIQDARQVLPAIARALDNRSAGSQATGDLLATIIGHRQILLVLDNFEHVASIATEISRLLTRCPHLSVLLTSRTTLHLAGGHDFSVAPLPLPDTNTPVSFNEIASNEAVKLFSIRAQSFRSDFQLNERNALSIAEICARVDGLPLAIEMAAARTRVLHPYGILARLEQRLPLLVESTRDAPSRQRTLRDTIAWSYDLLGAEEQRLFRTISVFAGGCTVDAVASVARVTPDVALDLLTNLVDSNLLQNEHQFNGEPRFRMLGTIREFGLEQLEARNERIQVLERCAKWCVSLSAEVLYILKSERLERIGNDLDNIREAFFWSVNSGHLEYSLALGWTIAVHWFLLGALNADAIESLSMQIEQSWPNGNFTRLANELADRIMCSGSIPPASPTELAIGGASWFAIARRDLLRAEEIGTFVLQSHQTTGQALLTGPVHCFLGTVKTQLADHTGAVHHLNLALPLLRSAGDTLWTPHALYYLGLNLYHLGDLDDATEYLQASRSRFESQQQGWGSAGPLSYLARIARDRNDLNQALRYHRDALALRHRYGDRFAAASTMRSIGEILIRDDQFDTATRILAAAASVGGTSQIVSPQARDRFEHAISTLQAALGPRRFSDAWATGAVLTFDTAVAEASIVELSFPTAVDEPSNELTPREAEVLRLLARGLTQPEIAETLFISPRTVSTHAAHIYSKLGVKTQAAAIAYAYQHGLVQPDKFNDH